MSLATSMKVVTMFISPSSFHSWSVLLAPVGRSPILGAARDAAAEVMLGCSNFLLLQSMLMNSPMIRLLTAGQNTPVMLGFTMMVITPRLDLASTQPLKEFPSAGRLTMAILMIATGGPLPECILIALLMMPMRVSMMAVVMSMMLASFTKSFFTSVTSVSFAVAVAHIIAIILVRRHFRAATPFSLIMKTVSMGPIAREGEKLMLMVMAFFLSPRLVVADPGPLGPPPFGLYHIHTTSVMNMKLIKLGVVWPGVKDPMTKLPFIWPRWFLVTAAKFIEGVVRSGGGLKTGGRVMVTPLIMPLPSTWFLPFIAIASLTIAASAVPRRAVWRNFL